MTVLEILLILLLIGVGAVIWLRGAYRNIP